MFCLASFELLLAFFSINWVVVHQTWGDMLKDSWANYVVSMGHIGMDLKTEPNPRHTVVTMKVQKRHYQGSNLG